jgi:hypothetical protein
MTWNRAGTAKEFIQNRLHKSSSHKKGKGITNKSKMVEEPNKSNHAHDETPEPPTAPTITRPRAEEQPPLPGLYLPVLTSSLDFDDSTTVVGLYGAIAWNPNHRFDVDDQSYQFVPHVHVGRQTSDHQQKRRILKALGGALKLIDEQDFVDF